MPRRRKPERIIGPYQLGDGRWRVSRRLPDGSRVDRSFTSEGAAKQAARGARDEVEAPSQTIREALKAYKKYQEAKGNRATSVTTTQHRLKSFFEDDLTPFHQLTLAKCRKWYEALVARQKSDTHRNALAEARTFLRWCRKQRWLYHDPLEELEPVGKRTHGKPQLQVDQSRLWFAKALELAAGGDPGAVAALMAVLLGLRASEIVRRRVGDLDDEGRLLHVPTSKTRKGIRTMEVPAILRPHLRALATGRKPDDPLLGQWKGRWHYRDFVRDHVHEICDAAKVPRVTAHAMRGLHSTIPIAAGVTPEIVAAALGHESADTTLESYADPAAVEVARRRALLRVLVGPEVEAPKVETNKEQEGHG